MDRLYIVIPAYNEEENIEQVIRDWHPVVERHSAEGTSRLVVIDDGSKDGTYKILQEYQKKYPLLEAAQRRTWGDGSLWVSLCAGARGRLRVSDRLGRADTSGGI